MAISASPATVPIQPGQDCQRTTTITTTAFFAFNSDVALSVSGLPAGVTGTLSASTIAAPGTGTSVLTLRVTDPSSLLNGDYPLTITATGSGLVRTTTVTLAIQNFTVAVAPVTPISVQPGGSATGAVTITPQGGFSGTVTLGIDDPSQLPAGTTVAFVPNPAGSASTMTITIADPYSAVAGDYPVTVAATSNCTVHKVGIVIRVKNFTLTTSPRTANAYKPGATARPVTITTVALPDWNAAVNLTVTGLPAGAKYTIKPNATISAPGAGARTLTLTAGPNTPSGVYRVWVIGKSGPTIHKDYVDFSVGNDFAISLHTPGTVTVMQGATVNPVIDMKTIGSFTGNISLFVAPGKLPSMAASPSLSPAAITLAPGDGIPPNPPKQTTLAFSPAANARPGTYTVKVTGIGNGGAGIQSHSMVINFVVIARP